MTFGFATSVSWCYCRCGRVPAGRGRPRAGPPGARADEEEVQDRRLLRGIPWTRFFEAMGMFASAMGNDCTFCHASNAYFDKNASSPSRTRGSRKHAR